jgi:hypothetical protein
MNASRCYRTACAAALAAVTLAARPADAQRVTVSGTVTDAANGAPIAAAVVKVDDDYHAAVSDAQGRFAIRGVRPGTRMVWANALGYGMSAGPVAVTAEGAGVDLLLDPDPVRLAAITATVSRFEARRRSYGRSVRVIEGDRIAGSGASDMRDFVELRAGLRRTSCGGLRGGMSGGLSCVNIRGRPGRPVVYVDEVRWPGGLDLLSSYRPWDVARVEVYGGGEQIRIYTRWFLEWAAEHNYQPWPILISG